MTKRRIACRGSDAPTLGLVVAFAALGIGCGGGGGGAARVLPRASKSSTIAITTDDRFVLMTIPETDSVAIVAAETNSISATVTTGDEPRAIVIHPNNEVAFVANRADATVVAIRNLDAPEPRVSEPVLVGSEPTGLALSPTGRFLYVAEWGEGRVSEIDTRTMAITRVIESPINPFSIAVTNNGDNNDADELIVVPEFYGEATDALEGTDTSRRGRVRIYAQSTLEPQTPIVFSPLDSGLRPSVLPDTAPTVFTSPNQLFSVAIAGTRIYATSISASPAPPLNFRANVYPVVYVGDLTTRTEVPAAEAGTTNLAKLVDTQIPAAPLVNGQSTRFFLSDIVDVAFVGERVGYVLSRGADVLQRVTYDPNDTNGNALRVELGAPQTAQIDLNVVPGEGQPRCQNPTGVVTSHAGSRAYVNCWVTRSIGVVDLSMQALTATIATTPVEAAEKSVQNGRRFFFTGRGRWSSDGAGWSACSSCHSEGLSDNITWTFNTGPRQSTSLDGSFSHGAEGAQVQRIFNWTGIFDEVHDFERNTRSVSGGLGAMTQPNPAIPNARCGVLSQEVRLGIDFENLGRGLRNVQDTALGRCTSDFDDMEAYIKSIRPPRGRRFVDAESVERGRALFGLSTSTASNAQCVACHGGPGWTVSRRFYDPSAQSSTGVFSGDVLFGDIPPGTMGVPFTKPASVPLSQNARTFQIEAQPLAPMALGLPEETIRVLGRQVSCVIRDVGTFGVPGDVVASNALEVRAAPFGMAMSLRAQGFLGYNVPSLYGMQVGAPYLHHGQARSLEELLGIEGSPSIETSQWFEHLIAGGGDLWLAALPNEEAKRQAIRDLIAYVLSVDASTPVSVVPSSDGCPASFAP